MRRVTIYSRPGCHLCDQMKSVVASVSARMPLAIEEIDISRDALLEQRYGEQIPVLLIDGKIAAKYRISEEEFERVLVGRG